MKKILATASVLTLALTASVPAAAADNKVMLPIADALAANDAEAKLSGPVKFYFAGQKTPKILTALGSDKTSQKTNGAFKAASVSCNWVFLSAMLALQKQAMQRGANAVVNIVSNYQNIEMASSTEFECHTGAIMSGVALKGDFVKIADK